MVSSPTQYDASPDAVRVLMETFWSAAGWVEPPRLTGDAAFHTAVASGLMFSAPVELDHSGWIARARAAVAQTVKEDVAEAFVASLTSRRLDLRSSLGSFAVGRHLPEHDYRAGQSRLCAICGLHERPDPQDLNILNFERFKWGGVRRLDVRYIAFDLEQFQRAPRLAPTIQDIELGRHLLASLRSGEPTKIAPNTTSTLRELKGNKAEREVLLEILAVTGVLASPSHPGFRTQFVPDVERELPSRRFTDLGYPACWWRASEGIDSAAVSEFLPQLV